jgi:hypothetical protein
MSEKYPNKRMVIRKGGRYAKLTAEDMGIGGACPVCRHFLIRVYDGDPNNSFVDPRLFRYRCFTCEPKTEAEKQAEAEKIANEPKFSMENFFSKATK